MRDKKDFGDFGENIAALYLSKRGYLILDRNFRCRFGELDIVALERKSSEIIFIEVKSRTSTEFGLPCEAVNAKKQMHIKYCAESYISYKKIRNMPYRMDIIEILILEDKVYLRHLKNAFAE